MSNDDLTGRAIGCAIEVHRQLGPGLLESTYEACLAHELKASGRTFQVQCPLPVAYKDLKLECGYRVDVLIEHQLIVELKAVERILGIHEAQLLTYMKLGTIRTGLLINFNVELLKNGVRRFRI